MENSMHVWNFFPIFFSPFPCFPPLVLLVFSLKMIAWAVLNLGRVKLITATCAHTAPDRTPTA